MNRTALIVCAAGSEGTPALISSLAADAEMIIAADGGGELCLEAGVAVDVVVGDLDSLADESASRLRELGASFDVHSTEKDASDLDLALAYARSRGVRTVVVTAAFSGRLDHTLAAIGSLATAADLNAAFVEPTQQGWVLASTGPETLHVSDAGRPFSVLSLSDDTTLSVEGARWDLDRVPVPVLSAHTISNVSDDPQHGATVRIHSGVALVIAPRP